MNKFINYDYFLITQRSYKKRKMKFNILEMQKKGSVAFGSTVDKAVGALVVIVLIGALAPEMFATNFSAIAGAPTWIGVVIPILIAVGILYLVWRAIK